VKQVTGDDGCNPEPTHCGPSSNKEEWRHKKEGVY
jgi:hypothetical protein